MQPSFDHLHFDFEDFVVKELKFKLINDDAICKFYLRGICPKGPNCEQRHEQPAPAPQWGRERSVVCKHWLRGLCKKGDACEFLHEYNLRKMPECWFYSKYGYCSNGDECMYLHVDPDSKLKECPFYARGFCKSGPTCRFKHVKKMVCQLFLTGFCPRGPDCPNGHPKWEEPIIDKLDMPTDAITVDNVDDQAPVYYLDKPQRNLENITCYKCQQRGHYANQCPQRGPPKQYNTHHIPVVSS